MDKERENIKMKIAETQEEAKLSYEELEEYAREVTMQLSQQKNQSFIVTTDLLLRIVESGKFDDEFISDCKKEIKTRIYGNKIIRTAKD